MQLIDLFIIIELCIFFKDYIYLPFYNKILIVISIHV